MDRQTTNWATTPLRYLVLSLYWFPISLFWGMMLGQILPARVQDFAGEAHKGLYLGIISVVGALASAVIQLFIGPISDHCRSKLGRRRPFMLVGTVAGCAAMLGFGWAHSFVMLTVSYFLVQLFINVANGPYQAYIPDHVPAEKQGMASAYMGLMQLLGEAGGPVLAGQMVSLAMRPFTQAGVNAESPSILHAASIARLSVFHELLLLDVLLLLLCVAVSAAFIPDPPSAQRATRSTLMEVVRWDVRSSPSFFWLLLSRSVYNLGFYVALAYLAYYVQDSLGFGRLNYSGPLTILQVITICGALAGTFPAGYFADRTSKKRVVYVSCAFSAAAAIVFAIAHTATLAYVMAVAFGIGYGIFRAVDWAFACNLLPPEGGAAKYMAIWSLSATLPQVLAPAFGPVADAVNRSLGVGAGWRAAMLVAGASVLFGAAVMGKVTERSVIAKPPATDELLAVSTTVP